MMKKTNINKCTHVIHTQEYPTFNKVIVLHPSLLTDLQNENPEEILGLSDQRMKIKLYTYK